MIRPDYKMTESSVNSFMTYMNYHKDRVGVIDDLCISVLYTREIRIY